MLFNSESNIRWIKKVDKFVVQTLIIFIYYLSRITGTLPKKKFFPKRLEKVLFIKLFGIGNIFLLLPAARMLKSNYPQITLDLLTLSFNKGIAEYTDDFGKAYYIEGSSFYLCAKDIVKNVLLIRKNNYSLVFDFDQFANISTLCSFFSNAFSVGFKTFPSRRHILYHYSVPYLEVQHMSEIFKTLLTPLGCRREDANTEFHLQIPERKIRDFFRDSDIDLEENFLIILHPGSSANFTKRRWPVQEFKKLAKKLINYDRVRIILTGNSQDETKLSQDIVSCLDDPHIINTSGKFTLEEFIALIKLSNLVIANDTAPIQISSHFHRPCVSLYGPNTPFLYGPKNNNSIVFYKAFACSPCISNLNSKGSNCRNPRCMSAISAEEVFQEIRFKFLQ